MQIRSVENDLPLLVRGARPLMGVISEAEGEAIVRYFADEQAADVGSGDESICQALALAGAWSDLDWDELEQTLDRIRHESSPTPPIVEL